MTARPAAAIVAAAIACLPGLARALPNDRCTSADAIKRVPFARTVAVDTATLDPSDPEPSCGGGANVWYAFEARADVSLEIDASGSGYPAGIAVFTGDCAALTEIACGNVSPDGSGAHVIVRLRRKQTVRIAITTDGSAADKPLTLAVRKSVPRYRDVGSPTEILRSTDASPYGGSQGFLAGAVAEDEATTAFTQSTSGIFVAAGGVVTTVAFSGSPTPIGGTFATFGPPVVSATAVYFTAAIDGGPVAEGIFRWNGSALEADLLPGSAGPDGTTLRDFRGRLAASATDVLVFLGRTANDNRVKLLRADGASVTLLAATGDATPCGGDTIRSFGADPAIGAAGDRVAFAANVSHVGDAILTSDGHALAAAVCQDDPTAFGGTHRNLGTRPAIDELGEVFFTSTVKGGTAAGSGVWVASAGGATPVARESTVLASGGTVRKVSLSQQLATNAAGDVAFTAALDTPGRAIVRRAHGAAAPSAFVLATDPCPAGGVTSGIDDELALSSAGTVVFDADCGGGHAALQKPIGGPPVAIASVATTTAVGTGMNVGQLAIDAAGTRVAGRGFRVTLQRLACGARACAPPVGLVDPSTPLANVPGQVAGSIFAETLAGDDRTLAFLATTAGSGRRAAVLRLAHGSLDALAFEGDVLPGGSGTFVAFSGTGVVIDATAAPGAGDGVVAFQADVGGHPTASEGVFAATEKGLTTIALEGDPAPRGLAFESFANPVVRDHSIVFAATTAELRKCVFATARPGRPLAAIACVGDALPAPVGGTVDDFLASPAGSASDLYVPVAVDAGSSYECLVRYRRGTPSLVRCRDDAFLDGSFYDSFAPLVTLPPTTDAHGKALLFLARDDSGVSFNGALLALRRGTLFPLLATDVSPAPVSGGRIAEVLSAAVAGKTVVAATTIDGGSTTSALVRLRLP